MHAQPLELHVERPDMCNAIPPCPSSHRLILRRDHYSTYLSMMIKRTKMMIKTKMMVSCLLSFAFRATVPSRFRACSSLV